MHAKPSNQGYNKKGTLYNQDYLNNFSQQQSLNLNDTEIAEDCEEDCNEECGKSQK